MSYSAVINFKKIEAENIQDFFSAIKKKIIGNFETIAGDECLYMPALRHHNINLTCMDYYDFKKKYPDLAKENSAWFDRLFRYRWFYDKEWKLLGILGLPNAVADLFDTSVCFQNSCDQDYERSVWQGMDEFLRVYDKWQGVTCETVQKALEDGGWHEENNIDLDYARRTLCYNEIWGRFSDSLFDDQSAVYFACFGYYDSLEKMKFLSECFKQAKRIIH